MIFYVHICCPCCDSFHAEIRSSVILAVLVALRVSYMTDLGILIAVVESAW